MFLQLDPVYLVFVGILVFFVGGAYLFVRKVLFGFRDGLESGRR
ncbi:DUF7859 family protein [Halalkalicoccus jeotgali]|uniref:Uncharacterized protein n=1 Tax=Halalkalicoccus jeotgali (strain DSM 18796 / CECT 7217 / JCM 14584 / KCTC 4019 / B3) TaxID=795797 RepID=D8J518_HALJB|nr:hypothetical protein [Halalkalicoccus jeotgali]ADJ13599.1 hypothetical protein HacjB3_01030 [Halalkalicoccus jeotgali B3]ELY33379.1 hypothetical protein C497_18302 [Halalkalicoccus jeotgali B3]